MTALMLAGAMTASMGTFAFADEAKELPTIDSIKLGEDYTDLTASIKVLTHRTDIVDTTFQDYIKKFNAAPAASSSPRSWPCWSCARTI